MVLLVETNLDGALAESIATGTGAGDLLSKALSRARPVDVKRVGDETRHDNQNSPATVDVTDERW